MHAAEFVLHPLIAARSRNIERSDQRQMTLHAGNIHW